MSTKTKTSGKRTKQKRLPGMELPKHKEIEAAADAYVAVRNRRMSLSEQEIEKNAILLEAMKKAGLKSYEFDGQTVAIVAGKEKAQVRRNQDENGEADDDSLVEKGRRHLEGAAAEVVKKTADGLKA